MLGRFCLAELDLVIAERISVRQIIVQYARHWAVCMYVCMYVYIYVRKKFRIVDCGFKA